MDSSQDAIDRAMMARCITLSRIAADKGEYPFSAVIALDGKIVAEAINRTFRDGDLSRHAEILALVQARKAVSAEQLWRCTVYSNVEPCAMCSYCIRETQVGRVAFALASPVMGGFSKWNVLRDDGLSGRIPQIFGPVPEVLSGLLAREAQDAWRDYHPLVWEMIKLRGLLLEPRSPIESQVHPAQQPSTWQRLRWLFSLFRRLGHDQRAATPQEADL